MPNKKRKGGRHTPPREDKMTGREVQYRLAERPPAALQTVLREMFHSGWARWMPVQALEVVAAGFDNANQDDVDVFEDLDLEAGLWVSEHKVDIEEEIPRRRADLKRFANAADMACPETVGGLAKLLAHYGVLRHDDTGRYLATLPLPLVSEAGVLDVAEVAKEDRLRWYDEFEPVVQKIIRIFVDDNRDEWQTNIIEVSEVLDVPAESAKAAVELLADEADFTVTPSLANIDLRDPLTISVDWVAFDENRISFR